jgi:BirA family biotin operon repressor/biotin-[acetyl-CoA-carboxylase] ligase
VCGILAETCETVRGRACVVGIGINLSDAAFPPEIAERATFVEGETGAPTEREALLAALTRHLARRYGRLQEPGGEAETLRAWSDGSTYAAGKRVRAALGDETIEGTTRGLEADGALRVELDSGEIKIVRAGDVSALRQANNESSSR